MPIATQDDGRTNLQRRLDRIDRELLNRLNGLSHRQDVTAERSIIIEGDPAASIFRVERGVVSVFKLLRDGRRQVTGFLYAGDFLGVTFNMDAVYGYCADAVTDCRLQVWPRNAIEHAFEESPSLRRLFLSEIADELTQAQDRIVLLAHRPIPERVASFLLTMARRQARATGARVETVEIPMRWSDIADYLGTTAESVSRTLSAMRDRDLVRTGKRGEIGILNWAELETIAAGKAARMSDIYR